LYSSPTNFLKSLSDKLLKFSIVALLTLAAAIAFKKSNFIESYYALGALILTFAFLFYIFYFSQKLAASVQNILLFISPLALAVLVNFFSNSKILSHIIEQTPFEQIIKLDSSKEPPSIVLIIFDEFPLNALLDKNQEIDKLRFPNFARFAANSTWYKNATTVNQFTPIALPSILTGLLPSEANKLPTASEFPVNLFTLFEKSHNQIVSEPFTKLCPERICNKVEDKQRTTSSIGEDLAAIYLNLVVPEEIGIELPSLDGKWGDFFDNQEEQTEKRERWFVPKAKKSRFANATNVISAWENDPLKPELIFLHMLLPHRPFEFLPSGEFYGSVKSYGYINNSWVDNQALIAEAYQRYLFQVAAADKLLGRAIEQLEKIKLYENSLVIVTADHGVSFAPGKNRRSNPQDPLFYQDILNVPLIIKYPGQTQGEISTVNAELLDILPTILDVAGATGSHFKSDGTTLLNKSGNNKKRFFVGHHPSSRGTTNTAPKDTYTKGINSILMPSSYPTDTIAWKYSLPGYSTPPSVFPFYIGERADLIGRAVSSIEKDTSIASNITISVPVVSQITSKEYLFNVTQEDSPKISYIEGNLPSNLLEGDDLLTFIINNKLLCFINKNWLIRDASNQSATFRCFLPENELKIGENSFSLGILRDEKLKIISKIS
jgi:hypothetical protein